MKISVVIQSYGSVHEYKRAVFSIISFYAYSSKPKEQTEVVLFTDRPDFFEPFLKELPIKYVHLTHAKIKEMRGSIDFVHRVKIAAIEEAFSLTEGNILYIDSDTFFISDPVQWMDQLSAVNAFMHENEYPFKVMKEFKLPAGKTFHIFYDFVTSRSFFLHDGSELRISPSQISWNAGVILLHREHQSFLKDVYKLTDDFYPDTKNHGCEQYAFSIILDRNTHLSSCKEMIYHYWFPIKKPIADKFLKDKITEQWASLSLSQKQQQVRRWTYELPAVFETDVLMTQYHAIQLFNEDRLKKGIGYMIRAFAQDPFCWTFIKDSVYHIRRLLLKNIFSRAHAW